ncbi:MAG: spermidine/putrescine ABC transporter substrate-binding protein [Oceanospirillaceae bacterium]
MKLVCSLFLSVLIATPLVHADTLRFLNWEDYLSNEVEQLWQQQGHNIDTILFDNDQERDAILIRAKKSRIDVAVIDESIGKLFGEQGKLLELNETNIPTLAHIAPFWRKRCGKYSVPYLWGTMGIAYRSDVISNPPVSWKAILEPSNQLKNHISMMDDYTDMLAPALFMQGFSLNTESKYELKQAFSTLKKQAPDVLTYDYPITFLTNNVKADQLYMAQVYGGDQITMNEKSGVAGLWKYVVPKEGTILWVDCLAISSDSENKALALQFINFLNQPEIAAKNSEQLFNATPNHSAKALLPKDFRHNRAIFPDDEIMQRSQLYQELSNENIKLRLRITNSIVNIYESSEAR